MRLVSNHPSSVHLILITLFFAISCSRLECSPPEPLGMKTIELGSAVDESSHIVSPTRVFAPGDDVHASIELTGSGSATVTVQWLADNHVVSTEARAIKATEHDRAAFHFVPPGGWPVGRNSIVFWMDPVEKHVAEFDVQ